MGLPLLSLGVLLVANLHFSTAQTNNTVPAPIVVPPSEYWEGDDGPWSTFQFRIGNPPQEVRLLASTASPVTWTVLDEACAGGDDSTCATLRGEIFSPNVSTTWKSEGIYNLYIEGNLNYTGNGEYGLDTLGLGLTSTQGPFVDGQVIAGIVTTEFDIGILGMNVQPTNFTNFTDPIPSFFQTLKNKNMIPSLTYSYTAGNQYSLTKVLGSLIFGGYDSSRFISNGMTFPFASDSTRDLVVGVQSISSTESSGKNTELLNSGILAYIDSTIPYLYLPPDVCAQFEDAFGLTWDPNTELYLISQSLHSSLVARNINFTFILGTSESSTPTMQIVLPYAAFDLTATSPLLSNGTSSYFPLRRGNETQWALGRTFLQEAYLIADYERGNFSISQCVFVEGAKADIQPIHPLGYVEPAANGTAGGGGPTGSLSSSSSTTSLAPGAIAGIAIAALLILAIGLIVFLTHRKRKWPFHKLGRADATELDSDAVGYEADGTMLNKYPEGGMPHEAMGDSKFDYKAELESQQVMTKNELPGVPAPVIGAHGELHGSDAALEMDGTQTYMELPADPVPVEYLGSSKPPGMVSRNTSRTTTTAGSPRHEAARRVSNATAGVRNPLSPVRRQSSGLSGLASPSPISAGSESRDPSRARVGSRTLSDPSSTEGHGFLQSPVSAGSESREGSMSRSRGYERVRGVSPMRLGPGVLVPDDGGSVSRDPSPDEGRGPCERVL